MGYFPIITSVLISALPQRTKTIHLYPRVFNPPPHPQSTPVLRFHLSIFHYHVSSSPVRFVSASMDGFAGAKIELWDLRRGGMGMHPGTPPFCCRYTPSYPSPLGTFEFPYTQPVHEPFFFFLFFFLKKWFQRSFRRSPRPNLNSFFNQNRQLRVLIPLHFFFL